MIFWLIIGIFTLAVASICFLPLLRSSPQTQSVQRDVLNKAFYFQRLQEIERDEKQGLLDNVSQAKLELQQSLLEDIPETSFGEKNGLVAQSAVKKQGVLWFFSGFLTLLILACLSYFTVGSWQAQQNFNQMYQQFNAFQARVQDEQAKPFDDQELHQFAIALRQHLQYNPNDAHSWWQLGQIAMNTDNAQQAFESYKRAHQLEPENTEYKLSYARVLMFSEDPVDKSQGETLLKQVIRQDHSNLEALGLLAFHYFEQEDYKMAAVSWSMMLKLLPEDDSKRPLIERSMNAAIAAQQEKEE